MRAHYYANYAPVVLSTTFDNGNLLQWLPRQHKRVQFSAISYHWDDTWNRSHQCHRRQEHVILCSQDNGCWCPGDVKSHGTSSHCTDRFLQKYSSLSMRKFQSFYFQYTRKYVFAYVLLHDSSTVAQYWYKRLFIRCGLLATSVFFPYWNIWGENDGDHTE